MNRNKKIVFTLLFCIATFGAFAQEIKSNNSENWFKRHFNQRIYFSYYGSYYHDNINMLQGGYDAVLKLIDITPKYNLIDFSIGLNGLMAFDQVNEPKQDNFGNMRPDHSRITPGFELNWCARLFILPISKINARLYVEGLGMSLVVYAREFPDINTTNGRATGSIVNIGSHVGMGMEYQINDNLKGYTSIRLFHASNGKKYVDNPALDAVGIIMGVQF
ncbi:MAG TPA: acyloxyacyl hydrolase [Salinivirgaceae bacterium]|nr:acyloxyacyl hydrolase [Salinivirgaceae bacterium]